MTARCAVITGVTSGIGLALVRRLLVDGWVVVGVGRDRDRLESMSREAGTAFRPACVDLSLPGARRQSFAALAAELPGVDAVVNNAAAIAYDSPLGLPLDDWTVLLETNLLAAVELVQTLAPRLGRGSTVVNVSSTVARSLPAARYAPYAVTKAALERATEGMRLELAPRGVRVTTVAPGLVDTPIYSKVRGFERAETALRAAIPEWLQPDDVAEAIGWILSRPPRVAVSDLLLLPSGQTR